MSIFTKAFAAACVGLWFVLIYNLSNYLATLSPIRIAPHFAWEIQIPVIPWTIVPYWSIDLLFLAGFFFCTARREVLAHSLRLALAILIAGIFFIAIPLTLAWPRVDNAGIFQPLFDALYTFDKPHNLAPSLHIAILIMLWPIYVRRTKKIVRFLVHLWMLLILLSVFTTHQHHLIDVVTAFPLGVFCWYLFPDSYTPTPRTKPNYTIAWRYWAGAIVTLIIAILASYKHPWRFILTLWPTLALTILGLAYAGLGARVFRKQNGKLPWSAKLVLAPVLLGTWAFHTWFRRGVTPYNKIGEHIFLGRYLSNARARAALEENVVAILDMTGEYSECTPFRTHPNYKNIPVLDYSVPSQSQLEEAVAFVTKHAKNGIVYVHCALGFSRSASIVAAVLIRTEKARTAEEAVAMIRRERPRIHVWEELRNSIGKCGIDVPVDERVKDLEGPPTRGQP
jgi:predicted protein tyrosine phosphatase